jgi:oxygen-dependent protoporphyrinogen oxidase
MMFRGARGAAALLDHDNCRLEAMFAEDLVAEFPEARGLVEAIAIKRWELGAPFSRPGRAGLQGALTTDLGPIALAGDYLEFPNLEAAIASGEEAADRVRARLGAAASAPNSMERQSA